MTTKPVDTLIVGGGQAGIAASAHLKAMGVDHLVVEKHRLAEAWRTSRWDNLVANGPAWHDRFPDKTFDDVQGDDFAPKESCARYFEDYASERDLPVLTGTEVQKVTRAADDDGPYSVETTNGHFEANNLVVATGAFHSPLIPPLIPEDVPIKQLHSKFYRNPDQLNPGGVLVVGAGSSGAQIADEIRRSGRQVYLSVGPHERPPRAYRGHDYCHWLGVLGKWEMKTPPLGREHVTISVSGAHGGQTVDFRRLAQSGIELVGMLKGFEHGTITFEGDVKANVDAGDQNYLTLLEEVDDYIRAQGLELPEEPDAKIIAADPPCLTNPIRTLDPTTAKIGTIIWATGYRQDFSWLQVDALDNAGKPQHNQGVAQVPGLYFLGLPWLTMRGSSFIWGVYKDAKMIAQHIANGQIKNP